MLFMGAVFMVGADTMQLFHSGFQCNVKAVVYTLKVLYQTSSEPRKRDVYFYDLITM